MSVYLISRDNKNQYLDNIATLSSNSSPLITNKSPSVGKWYYEVTHCSGSKTLLFGFSVNADTTSSFLLHATQYLRLYSYRDVQVYYNSTTKTASNYTSLSFPSLETNYTVGLAFDSFSKIFSIYYNENFIHLNIDYTQTIGKVTPFFLEGTGDNVIYRDRIKVNFGKEKFKYKVPFGYKPWQDIWKNVECTKSYHIFSVISHSFLFFCILC